MFPYFRRYVIFVCECTVCVPLIVTTVWMAITQTNVMGTLYGLVAEIVMLVASLFISFRYFSKKADALAQSLVNRYDSRCDPKQITDEGSEVAESIMRDAEVGKSITEMASWFLSFYALALADTGKTDEARRAADAMAAAVLVAKTPLAKGTQLMNLEPVALRLHGPDDALSLAEEALGMLQDKQDADTMAKRAYLNNETKLLRALCSHDTDTLVSTFERIYKGEEFPLRMRVLDADALGEILVAKGDTEGARTAWRFAVENGGGLPVVSEARRKLAALRD